MIIKLKSLIISIIVILCSCKDENLTHQIFYYRNGNKKIERYLDAHNKTQGKLYSYYPSGNLEMIIDYKNGRACGKFWSFYENNHLQNISKVYRTHKIDTSWNFSENGILESKYIFGKGLAQDTIKEVEYYPNRRVKSEIATIQGQKLTPYVSYIIQYKTNGKIDFPNSNFVYIKYLNKLGTKILFIIKRGSNFNIPDFKNRVGLIMNLKNNFKAKFSLEKNNVRTIELPNSNSFIVTFSNKDYIDNKLNINLIEKCQPGLYGNSMFLYLYNIQLKKGDKSRWHNVHGIVKD